MPTLGPINEANLGENTGRRESGKAGGRFEKQQLSIGRPITKLVGIAMWKHCNSLEISCTTLRGGSENPKTNPFGATPFDRAFFVVGDQPARRSAKRQRSRRLISPTEFASFQPREEFGGKLRVPVGLAEGGHTTSKSSGGTRPFEANLTASLL